MARPGGVWLSRKRQTRAKAQHAPGAASARSRGMGYVGAGRNGGVVTRLVLEPHGTTAGMIIVSGFAVCPDQFRWPVRPPAAV